MTPFRLGHDEFQHELPWLLMRNGPVTKYWQCDVFEQDIEEMLARHFDVRRFDCAQWHSEDDMHAALKVGLVLPAYTGSGFDAFADSLTDIEVPQATGVLVALDNFSEAHRGDLLLKVLASASRWWLLIGRVFCVVLRTDDPRYEGPRVGGARPMWNGREWLDAKRGL